MAWKSTVEKAVRAGLERELRDIRTTRMLADMEKRSASEFWDKKCREVYHCQECGTRGKPDEFTMFVVLCEGCWEAAREAREAAKAG